MHRIALLLLGVILAGAACTSPTRDDDASNFVGQEYGDEFVEIVHRDLQIMYDPFRSPEEAIELSDVAVGGRIVSAQIGPVIATPNDLASCAEQVESAEAEGIGVEDCVEPEATEPLEAFIEFEAVVTSVYKGDEFSNGDKVTFYASVAPIAAEEALQAAPGGAVVLIMSDETDWDAAGGEWEWPNAAPDRVLIPYPDGLWFLGRGNSAVGPYADLDTLPPGWDEPKSLQDLQRRLEDAS